jgi:hypothetical protein
LSLKPTAIKLSSQTRAIRRVERLRLVAGILPQEIRETFDRKAESTANRDAALHLSLQHPELLSNAAAHSPFTAEIPPTRPNFWIPILMVLSYVVPFFIFLFITVNIVSNRHLMSFLFPKWGPLIILPIPYSHAFCGPIRIFSPSILGIILAYVLYRTRIQRKRAILIWFATIIAFCCLDIGSIGILQFR